MSSFFCVRPHPKRGFTIVELLVALVIGLIVVLVVGRLFTMNSISNHQIASLGRMQENARFAIDLLGNDIRSAGDLGCNGLLEPTLDGGLSTAGQKGYLNISRDPNLQTAADDVIMAYTPTTSTSTMPDGLAFSEVTVGNDVVSIKRGDTSNRSALTVAQASGAGGTLTVDSGNVAGFQSNDLLLLNNCVQAEVFQAATVSGGTITAGGGSLGGTAITHFSNNTYFAQFTEVMRFINDIYYIGNGTAPSGVACPLNALCRKALISGVPTTEVLANNVQSFNVFLGLLNKASQDYIDAYESPSTLGANDWCRVGAVQVNLVFRGDDNLTSKVNTKYWVNNTSVTPAFGDYRLRRGYSQVFFTYSRQKLIKACN